MRAYPDKKLVKVRAASQRKATCKVCGEPVEWFKTVNRERYMLFNGDCVPLMVGQDEPTGDALLYLDRGDCHWEKCSSKTD